MEPADRPTFAQVNDELQILPAIVRQLLKPAAQTSTGEGEYLDAAPRAPPDAAAGSTGAAAENAYHQFNDGGVLQGGGAQAQVWFQTRGACTLLACNFEAADATQDRWGFVDCIHFATRTERPHRACVRRSNRNRLGRR